MKETTPGEATPDILYRAVGEALTRWETAEQALAHIFAFVTSNIVDIDRNRPAIRAYGKITGNKERISMVRAALDAWFHIFGEYLEAQELKGKGLKLLSEMERTAAKRNDIAHGRVDRFIDIENSWYLFPGLFSTGKRPLDGSPSYRYSSAEIIDIGDTFLSLHNALIAYLSEIMDWHAGPALRAMIATFGRPKAE